MGEPAAPARWTIREAGGGDADLLSLIGAATFLETFADVHTGAEIVEHCSKHHSSEAYRALLAGGADAWLVETQNTHAPLGYAVLADVDLPGAEPDDLELKRIYTLARLHGSGAAAELMDQVMAQARRRGAARLLLDVYSRNGRAIAFYRRYGFRKIADVRFFVGATGYDDVVLAAPLEKR